MCLQIRVSSNADLTVLSWHAFPTLSTKVTPGRLNTQSKQASKQNLRGNFRRMFVEVKDQRAPYILYINTKNLELIGEKMDPCDI